MERIIANFNTGKVRYATLGGRRHVVVSLGLIVPGVLNGSKGALFYPPEQVSANPDIWNHTPIVVYHPNFNGQHVSARHPDVLDKQGIGIVLKSKYQNNKLVAEGWIDIEAANRVDNRIMAAIEQGQKIELSTGLFTENEIADDGSNYKGKGYQFIAKNYKPDHVAILPDQIGACSIQDGCGVLVNQGQKTGWYSIANAITRDTAGKFSSGGGDDEGADEEDMPAVKRDPKKEKEKAAKEKKRKEAVESGSAEAETRIEESRSQGTRNQWTPIVNAFCPTGSGGGVDPSCSPGGSGGVASGGSGTGPKEYPRGQNLQTDFHGKNPAVSPEVTAKALSDFGIPATPDSHAGATAKVSNTKVIKTLKENGWKHEATQVADGHQVDAFSHGNWRATVHEDGPRTTGFFVTKAPTHNQWKPIANDSGGAPSEDIDPDKACQILHDGTVHGHELTDDQRKMFGAACSSVKNTEQWIQLVLT